MSADYTEDNIRTLDWKEHIRFRPGMYIGKLGNGKSPDDGIYILLKEVIDNCIDEFVMGHGKTVDVSIHGKTVRVRDYGRGVPLGKVVDVVSKINTGAKYDSKAFKKSVGLNGVGTKAVNALSSMFKIDSVREEKIKTAEFCRGNLTNDFKIDSSPKRKGTKVTYIADDDIFGEYTYRLEYIERMLWNYAYLNTGLTINFNGKKFYSENGLLDLMENNITEKINYPIIHLKGDDIEVALTHGDSYGENYQSFVNGQHTTMGGTHQGAFRELIATTIKEFYGKSYDSQDVRASIIGAISVKVIEPIFESQTKTKLGSTEIEPGGKSMRAFIGDFLKKELDNIVENSQRITQSYKKRDAQNSADIKALEDATNILSKALTKGKKIRIKNLIGCTNKKESFIGL